MLGSDSRRQARSLHPTDDERASRIPSRRRTGKSGKGVAILRCVEETTYKRRSLIPRAAIIAGAIVTALIAGAVWAGLAVYRSQLVTVPDLVLVPGDDAQAALEDLSLSGVVIGTRVSADVPEGCVLSQDPVGGASVRSGAAVSLVLSAGSQTVRVPDLVGVPVDEATAALAEAGFRVDERVGASEETRTVILEMYPAPGTLVNTGDTIRITVPGESGASEVLLPYEMAGVSVLVDPSTHAGSDADAALEVARRLVSLLQASGAEASLTRMSSDAETSRGQRVEMSRESTASVFIGFDVGAGTGAGITVMYLDGDSVTADGVNGATLATAITSALRSASSQVNPTAVTDDPVLGGFAGEGVRVHLGDTRDEGDGARLGDPAWADEVARGVYRALGSVYGSR